MDDLISRQDAFDVLCKSVIADGENLAVATAYARQWAVDKIAELPSVQPEIIRCKDCKHYNDYYHQCEHPHWTLHEDVPFAIVAQGDYCSYAERRES